MLPAGCVEPSCSGSAVPDVSLCIPRESSIEGLAAAMILQRDLEHAGLVPSTVPAVVPPLSRTPVPGLANGVCQKDAEKSLATLQAMMVQHLQRQLVDTSAATTGSCASPSGQCACSKAQRPTGHDDGNMEVGRDTQALHVALHQAHVQASLTAKSKGS